MIKIEAFWVGLFVIAIFVAWFATIIEAQNLSYGQGQSGEYHFLIKHNLIRNLETVKCIQTQDGLCIISTAK